MNIRKILKRSEFLKAFAAALRKIPMDISIVKNTAARKSVITEYLATTTTRKLQIGCGKNILDGWLNCDFTPASPKAIFLDATAPFPFPDSSFDFVFSEHMIEHVPYAAGQKMLGECFRILKPGGVIRISTPNLRNVASLMAEPLTPEKQLYIKTATDKYIPANKRYLPGFALNNFYWDFMHYFIYDPETLSQAFEEAGFSLVQAMKSGIGSVPELSGLECHAKIVDPRLDDFETMIFEATKALSASA